MRYGSLFSGYGGLDDGVQSVLGGTTAWHCEMEPAPSKILAHHWPATPNLGDITQVRWADVEPVDVLTGGFPCQDVSHAGKRLGLKPGTRSGLWSHMAYAIDQLRPGLVVAENVRGLLSAEAGGDLEPCPWCVGDGERGALRALGAVLGDLADLGYDAQWVGVRAADAGAPHGRFRVFVFAWPAQDADVAAGRERRVAAPGQAEGGRPRADAGRRGRAPATHTDDPAHDGQRSRSGPADRTDSAPDAPGDGRDEGRPEPAGLLRGPDAPQRSDAPPADTDRDGLAQLGRQQPIERDADRRGGADIAWGDYEPAVRRWERLTRPAPAPTQISETWTRARAARFRRDHPMPVGRRGSLARFLTPERRLSPLFVEWMQGLPAGHVTDPTIGLTRNEQLKALGNGVVPQQAALATRLFLNTAMERAA